MSLLSSAAAFLKNTLPTTVLYTEPGQSAIELQGVFPRENQDRRGEVGIGAERYDATSTFHVEQSILPVVNRRAIITMHGHDYRIAHFDVIQDATWRLILERAEKGAASPTRPNGRR